MPARPLNARFLRIIETGTGHAFTLAANACWEAVARPVLEAFFHARFMLEMACRYAGPQEPPETLPSGYAALLYLFNLR
jgi:hypothetical protein